VTETVLTQVLNGLSLASILILIALGLAVIFGLLGVINLAHADLFMTGMYALALIQGRTGSFWLGVLAAPLVDLGLSVGSCSGSALARWTRYSPLSGLVLCSAKA
jgi:branched-subunit amino acid ABC-type transport system permease component